MKFKKFVLMIVLTVGILAIAGCASTQRSCKSCQSDIAGGLDRIVNIYTLNGELLATYEGLIDIDDNENDSIMFDLDGKRYVYYNAIIEVIEK